ncbi:hypothetical protein Q3G72_006032 [Acer saccharum]|nr:hypothetical protein Q3G72_006032 [Acer saccharum]
MKISRHPNTTVFSPNAPKCRVLQRLALAREVKKQFCVFKCLHPYAKHLSALQKLEISKEGPTVKSFGKEYESENAMCGNSFPRESFMQDVPAMEAICKKLEEAN